MYRTRSIAIAASLAATLVAGPAVMAQGDTPVTLRFAVSDGQGKPSEPYVTAFIDEVAHQSGGSVTLAPEWEASPDFEQGVAKLLVAGDADLGLVASRGWDAAGVTSLEALQAPFLIDDDALALAVSTSTIADDLLAGMAGWGITGLAMWPEDLRHPAVFESCVPPITTPDQLRGLHVRAIASAVTRDLLEKALGATWTRDISEEDIAACRVQAVESGLRQGATLPAAPTFTGDVTFFPKFQVLAANSAALSRLSDDQRAAITAAALAVRDQAVAQHPTEAQAAADWCAGGGRVVLAGPAAIAAFQQAAQPVSERIAADPVAAAAIEAIRALKSTVTPTAGAVACAAPPQPSPTPIPEVTPAALIPDGTYRADITPELLEAFGLPGAEAAQRAGARTLEVHGDQLRVTDRYGASAARLRTEGDHLVIAWDPTVGTSNGEDRIYWSLANDALVLVPAPDSSMDFVIDFGTAPFMRIP